MVFTKKPEAVLSAFASRIAKWQTDGASIKSDIHKQVEGNLDTIARLSSANSELNGYLTNFK